MTEEILFHEMTKNPNLFLNKHIEIFRLGDYTEVNYEERLRCVVTKFKLFDEGTTDEHYEIFLDFKPYEEYNKSVMTNCFYGDNNQLNKKWIDTNHYQRYNGTDSIYIPTDIEHCDKDSFKFIDTNIKELYQLFKESGHKNYVEFLEEISL